MKIFKQWSFLMLDPKNEVIFSRDLFGAFCPFVEASGKVCNKYTSRLHPYCIKCVSSVYSVTVLKSTILPPTFQSNHRSYGITSTGYGLFAFNPANVYGASKNIVFRKGDYIAPYLGEVVGEEYLKKYVYLDERGVSCDSVGPFLIKTRNGTIIEGACKRGPATYANHSRTPNAAFAESPSGDDVYLIAVNPISQREEITVDYGLEYWELGNRNYTVQQNAYIKVQ